MSKLQIPFHRPLVHDHHVRAVEAALRSGWLTSAGQVDALEKEFSGAVGAKHAVAVNSCTAALHLALIALGVGPGDEVITSAITFASAVNVIEHVGAKPVFADVLPGDLTIDPASVMERVTPATKAIIATHFAGLPAAMRALEVAAGTIPIISDAAHSIETQYHGLPSGQLGKVSCYSFYANKNITTGEGGMLTTNDDAVAELARVPRLHGMTKDAWSRYGPDGYKHWDIVRPGWKYNMSDIQAALGRAQLAEMGKWLAQRVVLEATYRSYIDRSLARLLEPADQDIRSARHLFVVRVKNRDRVMAEIQGRGVGVGVHFRAVHTLKYYREKYPHLGALPVAEEASDQVLSLPLYPAMEPRDVLRVLEVFHRVAAESEMQSS